MEAHRGVWGGGGEGIRLRIVMQIFTTQHLVACAWYDLGIMNERGWVTHWQLQGRSKEFQYLTALHWTRLGLNLGSADPCGQKPIKPRTSQKCVMVAELRQAIWLRLHSKGPEV